MTFCSTLGGYYICKLPDKLKFAGTSRGQFRLNALFWRRLSRAGKTARQMFVVRKVKQSFTVYVRLSSPEFHQAAD